MTPDERSAENDATWCACGCGVRLPHEPAPRVTAYASPNCYARAARAAAGPEVITKQRVTRVIPPAEGGDR